MFNLSSCNNFIIRMPNWIGDFVMAVPTLHALRRYFPKAHIAAVAKEGLISLLSQDKAVDQQIPLSALHTINRQSAAAILLTNSFSSAFAFFKMKVPVRLGYKGDYRRFLLTHPLPFPAERKQQHLVKTYLHLLHPLGVKPGVDLRARLFLSQKEREKVWEILHRKGVYDKDCIIGMQVGAAYGEAKCWPPSHFRLLTKALIRKYKCKVLFVGCPSSSGLIESICKGFEGSAINLAGATCIRKLMAVIASCRLFITNDSGPMHIADALNVPVIALFGSTDPRVTGPSTQSVVIQNQVACSPCFKRTCPIDFRCMRGISVEQVLEKVNL